MRLYTDLGDISHVPMIFSPCAVNPLGVKYVHALDVKLLSSSGYGVRMFHPDALARSPQLPITSVVIFTLA